MSSEHLGEQFRVPKGGFGPIFHGARRVKHSGEGMVARGRVFDPEPVRGAPHPLEGPILHAGTRRAAHERLRDLDIDPTDDEAILYEMTVRTGASVGPLVHDYTANAAMGDERYIPKTADDVHGSLDELAQFDVLPYVNSVEDPDSISYAVKPSAVRNVRPTKQGRTADPTSLKEESRTSPELIRPGTPRPPRRDH